MTAQMVEDTFHACAVLNNMLLVHDGLDTLGSHATDWKPAAHVDLPPVPAADAREPAAGSGFAARRDRLRTHFHVASRAQEVLWMKSRGEVQADGPNSRHLEQCTDQEPCRACTR
jgi:hypothetical protein